VQKVAVYEVPYLMGEEMRQAWLSYVDDLKGGVGAGAAR